MNSFYVVISQGGGKLQKSCYIYQNATIAAVAWTSSSTVSWKEATMERVRLAVRTRRRQTKLHILRHTHSAPMYSFVCRYLQVYIQNTPIITRLTPGGGGGSSIFSIFFGRTNWFSELSQSNKKALFWPNTVSSLS